MDLEKIKSLIKLGDPSQVGILVKDARATAGVFEALLGIGPWRFESWPPENRPDFESSYKGQSHRWKTSLAFAQFNNIELELIESVEGKSAYTDFMDFHGQCIHHILFEVDDLDAVVDTLKEHGIKEKMWAVGRKPGTRWVLMDTEKLLGFDLELKNKLKVE